MTGSAKQIKWAEDIIAGARDSIQRMRDSRAHYDAIQGPDNHLYPLTSACIDAIAAEVEGTLAEIESMQDFPASKLIEKRNMFSFNAIFRHAEDWMRYFG